ncbi:MAG: class I SAM-dependent methyltransferase [Planctomycetes bacterium]|nr:class I SAM-dependent methyltransferase [Planctomycetota bacterium]
MSVGGREYYAEFYADYERQSSARKLDFYMQLVRRFAPPGAELFELGVGLGNFLARASTEYRCTGSEVNDFGLAEARRRVPSARLLAGSYEQIPSERPPAVVVAWDVLEHIPQIDAALACIRARLAEPGYLIAVVPVYDGPLGGLVRALDRDPTHVSKWARHAWLAAFERNGFTVLDWGGVVRRLVLGRYYLHVARPRGLMQRVGSAIWIVGGTGAASRAPLHGRAAS